MRLARMSMWFIVVLLLLPSSNTFFTTLSCALIEIMVHIRSTGIRKSRFIVVLYYWVELLSKTASSDKATHKRGGGHIFVRNRCEVAEEFEQAVSFAVFFAILGYGPQDFLSM